MNPCRLTRSRSLYCPGNVRFDGGLTFRDAQRTHLIEMVRPALETIVQNITAVKVLSLHHDISTTTGEEIVVFTLSEPPLFRETKKT